MGLYGLRVSGLRVQGVDTGDWRFRLRSRTRKPLNLVWTETCLLFSPRAKLDPGAGHKTRAGHARSHLSGFCGKSERARNTESNPGLLSSL